MVDCRLPVDVTVDICRSGFEAKPAAPAVPGSDNENFASAAMVWSAGDQLLRIRSARSTTDRAIMRTKAIKIVVQSR